jgi:hypothetical protein
MIFRPYSQQRQCMTYVKNHFLSLSIIQNLFYSIIIIDESSTIWHCSQVTDFDIFPDTASIFQLPRFPFV